MSIRLSLNLEPLKAKLRKLKDELDEMDGLWDRISDIMVEETHLLWDSEGATAVPPWPPLAEATIEKKTRMGVPLDPMVETGALKESFFGEFTQGRSSLGTFTSKEFSWGTDVEYAKYHQEGPEHNDALPVRNVVNITPLLLTRVHEAADDWLEDAVRDSGFGRR